MEYIKISVTLGNRAIKKYFTYYGKLNPYTQKGLQALFNSIKVNVKKRNRDFIKFMRGDCHLTLTWEKIIQEEYYKNASNP